MIQQLNMTLWRELPYFRLAMMRVKGLFCALSRSSCWLIGVLALAWFNLAWGGVQSDPTRPSPRWFAAQSAGQNVPTNVTQVASSGGQFTLTGDLRKFAIIDGKVVRQGDTFNGSKVVNIKSGEIVVKNATKSLKVTRAVEKRESTSDSLRKTERVATKANVLLNGSGRAQ